MDNIMNLFNNYFVDTLKNHYVDYKSRATRAQYWYYVLFSLIISFLLAIVDGVLGIDLLSLIFGLATLVPSFCLGIRRLHDLGKSGWTLLICLIPIVGAFILLYWFCLRGQPTKNQYGEAIIK